MRNAEVEVREDELDGGEEEACKRNAEVCWVGGFGLSVPAESVGPGDLDFVDLDAARFGEAKADVVPVVLLDVRSVLEDGDPDLRQIQCLAGQSVQMQRCGALSRHIRPQEPSSLRPLHRY